ncbi:DUF4139 domain-containing protein [Sphingosinicella terrae]|uniref:DUF4139 domain-containing protein n=1 Tax=Sphingosinicella terrae TaxID=2172047 RepID=UPI0013B3F9B9|nr:hypothetical protein [Sphingosinicella terrae]
MRRGRVAGGFALLALLLGAASASAQTIVASPAPAEVDVTVYRDPARPPDRDPNLRWLNGFALVSETRRISLPAGESQVRFEGVAGGILPQSAIVTGFPDGIVERNRDAYLLSPATLLDRSLGRRVHLRRTSEATGEVREHEAIVRSGADGAVVLQTESGFEALRCTGLRETPVYDSVPAELATTPTLSVRARSSEPVTATITLSYLASGFDWQADYIATLSPEGDRMELFAWLTLASGDETSFEAADTQAVAGRLNRRDVRPQPSEGPPLNLRCWPQGTTSDIDEEQFEQVVVTGSRMAGFADMMAPPPPPPPPAPPPPPPAMQAVQEELGDLKLYRIPEPVTVAARSQKQVALLQRPRVRTRFLYRHHFGLYGRDEAAPATRVIATRNRDQEGLGLPLPAGRIRVFSSGGPRPILLGQGTIADRAVGEEVDFAIGPAPGVQTAARLVARTTESADYELIVTNDGRAPVAFEGQITDHAGLTADAPLGRRGGLNLWAVTVPANGRATLRVRVPANR